MHWDFEIKWIEGVLFNFHTFERKQHSTICIHAFALALECVGAAHTSVETYARTCAAGINICDVQTEH